MVAAVLVACGPRELEVDTAIDCDQCATWNEPIEPFRVYGNTWYVGTDGLSSILIEAGDDLILIDGGLPQSAPLIIDNIRTLGFEPRNISAILVSHAHFDHAGGVNALQRFTGAPIYFSEAGATALENGTLPEHDPQFGHGPAAMNFPGSTNVHAVEDGGTVVVGDLEVTAVYTPGHTPGGMSWTWQSCALDTCYDIVYADSLTSVSAPGFKYGESGAAADIVDSAGRIADLDCDILLSPHPFFFGMHDKLEKLDDGNPFVNNVACMMYAETMLGWLEQRLAAERN